VKIEKKTIKVGRKGDPKNDEEYGKPKFAGTDCGFLSRKKKESIKGPPFSGKCMGKTIAATAK